MRTHIDWITFTMTMRFVSAEDNENSLNEEYANAINRAFNYTFDPETLAGAFGGEWEKQEKSRAPYTDSWAQRDNFVTLYAGISLNHCCVEISGKGCEILIEKNLLEKVISSTQERVTRIDIACDIQTDIRPAEFVTTLKHKRMRASGRQISASGETEYVGSKTSDRFARVYRYNEPHPRAHLLRVEHVFHKAYAKRVASEIIDKGVESVANASGMAFGWAHEVWDTEADEGVDLSVVQAERNAGKTVFWLVNSVAPAFKRLCDDGTISAPDEFIKKYFLDTYA